MASLLDRVKTQLGSLPRAEGQVASWILANPRRSAELAIGELAVLAEVSEPTIVRFCRSMNLTGYREFKAKLTANLHQPDNYLHHDVDEADSAPDAFNKVLDSAIRALVDLRDHTQNMPIETTVKTMASSRQIIFVGVGASGHVARDARDKFFRLGLPCTSALDAQTIIQFAAIAQPSDTFIAVSTAGTWPDLIKSMTNASHRGATVVALTDPQSPLAAAADHVFACHPHEDTNLYTPMKSRMNHLALLDALQVSLALELGPAAQNNLRLSKDALSQARLESQHSATRQTGSIT